MLYYLKEKFTLTNHRGYIYDEDEQEAYVFESSKVMLPQVHLFKDDAERGSVKSLFSWLNGKYEIYVGNYKADTLLQESWLKGNRLYLEQAGWTVEGNFMGSNYDIKDNNGMPVATVRTKVWSLTQKYEIDIIDEEHETLILLLILGIYLHIAAQAAAAAAAA